MSDTQQQQPTLGLEDYLLRRRNLVICLRADLGKKGQPRVEALRILVLLDGTEVPVRGTVIAEVAEDALRCLMDLGSENCRLGLNYEDGIPSVVVLVGRRNPETQRIPLGLEKVLSEPNVRVVIHAEAETDSRVRAARILQLDDGRDFVECTGYAFAAEEALRYVADPRSRGDAFFENGRRMCGSCEGIGEDLDDDGDEIDCPDCGGTGERRHCPASSSVNRLM